LSTGNSGRKKYGSENQKIKIGSFHNFNDPVLLKISPKCRLNFKTLPFAA